MTDTIPLHIRHENGAEFFQLFKNAYITCTSYNKHGYITQRGRVIAADYQDVSTWVKRYGNLPVLLEGIEGGYFEHIVAFRAYLYGANVFLTHDEKKHSVILLKHDGEVTARIIIEDGNFNDGVIRETFATDQVPAPLCAPTFTEAQIKAFVNDPAIIFIHPHVPEIWEWARQLPLARLLEEYNASSYVRKLDNDQPRLSQLFTSLGENQSDVLLTVGTGRVAIQQFRGPMPARAFENGDLWIDTLSSTEQDADRVEGTEIRFSFDKLALWHVRFRDYESLYATDTATGELALVLENDHRTPKDEMMAALEMAFGTW